MATEVVEEDVDFGPLVGTLRLRQLAPLSFNEACKSSTLQEAGGTDCTGQRVYAGCQTVVRFLAHHPWLVRGQAVVELGCGVGALGLAVAGRLGARRAVLTDGQPSTLELARVNAEALRLLQGSGDHGQGEGDPGQVSVRRLLFGSGDESCRALLAEEGLDQGGVEVVLGAELMYYNVDPAAVLATAAALIRKASAIGSGDRGGLILLAHIFRGAHLPQALADAARALSLWVLSVPMEEALTEADRGGGASYWTNVSLLVCLPRAPGVSRVVGCSDCGGVDRDGWEGVRGGAEPAGVRL